VRMECPVTLKSLKGKRNNERHGMGHNDRHGTRHNDRHGMRHNDRHGTRHNDGNNAEVKVWKRDKNKSTMR
jgi:hypothetical protein